MICSHNLYFECLDPARNKRAYYRVVAGRDLYGLKIVKSWGRIGHRETPRVTERYTNMEALHAALEKIIKTRLAHGYSLQKR